MSKRYYMAERIDPRAFVVEGLTQEEIRGQGLWWQYDRVSDSDLERIIRMIVGEGKESIRDAEVDLTYRKAEYLLNNAEIGRSKRTTREWKQRLNKAYDYRFARRASNWSRRDQKNYDRWLHGAEAVSLWRKVYRRLRLDRIRAMLLGSRYER